MFLLRTIHPSSLRPVTHLPGPAVGYTFFLAWSLFSWEIARKGTTEDEMVGQCHQSEQHESDPTSGGSGRQEGLACSGPWGHEESDTTQRLNNKGWGLELWVTPVTQLGVPPQSLRLDLRLGTQLVFLFLMKKVCV